MTVSSSVAWRVNAASTTDLPLGLNFSILALLSSDDGVRRMSPLSSNRSTAAVIEYGAREPQSMPEETSHVLQHIDLADPQSRRRLR